MKRSLLLPIQARARERERVQRDKSRKGLVGGRESPSVMGLFASARGVEPWGLDGFPPMNLGENTAPHPSLQEGQVLKGLPAQNQGMATDSERLREKKEEGGKKKKALQKR